MSTKASIYYDSKEDVHIYREMLSNDVFIELGDDVRLKLPKNLSKVILKSNLDTFGDQ